MRRSGSVDGRLGTAKETGQGWFPSLKVLQNDVIMVDT